MRSSFHLESLIFRVRIFKLYASVLAKMVGVERKGFASRRLGITSCMQVHTTVEAEKKGGYAVSVSIPPHPALQEGCSLQW